MMVFGETTLSTKASPSASVFGDGRNGTALALASHDNDAALVALVLGKAAVDAVLFQVGRPDDAAEHSSRQPRPRRKALRP